MKARERLIAASMIAVVGSTGAFAYDQAQYVSVRNGQANCAWCDLSGADLSNVNISGIDLSGANLTGANISGSILTKADLSGADLTGAVVAGTDLSGSNLAGADLDQVDLSRAVLVDAVLASDEATGATLLGTDAWNHPDLVSIGRHHVEGAMFTSSFYANSSVGYVRDFSDRYKATFSTTADDLSAHAYDAANLILVQLARGIRSRSDLRDQVLGVSAFPGVSGVLSMGADGNARKRPFLLGVQRGRIRELD